VSKPMRSLADIVVALAELTGWGAEEVNSSLTVGMKNPLRGVFYAAVSFHGVSGFSSAQAVPGVVVYTGRARTRNEYCSRRG